jgi:hypothetical protein
VEKRGETLGRLVIAKIGNRGIENPDPIRIYASGKIASIQTNLRPVLSVRICANQRPEYFCSSIARLPILAITSLPAGFASIRANSWLMLYPRSSAQISGKGFCSSTPHAAGKISRIGTTSAGSQFLKNS